MRNVHSRLLNHPIEEVRPWIERAWSGTDEDVFPRDYIRSWRKNPEGTPASALVEGVTKLGHGPFRFRLTQWDGNSWRVELADGSGWHGFRLESEGQKTRITHELEVHRKPLFRFFILPIHDWAVESIFDRLEAALATGKVPARTTRPMSSVTRALYQSARVFV